MIKNTFKFYSFKNEKWFQRIQLTSDFESKIDLNELLQIFEKNEFYIFYAFMICFIQQNRMVIRVYNSV